LLSTFTGKPLSISKLRALCKFKACDNHIRATGLEPNKVTRFEIVCHSASEEGKRHDKPNVGRATGNITQRKIPSA
jgi:hypothetical protein